MSINTPSQRPDETRANYTRAYLSSNKIDFTELSNIATDMDSPITEKDFKEDTKLISWVKNIQKKIGFAEVDNATGQDGMIGPRTLREIRRYVVKNKTGKATDAVASSIEHRGYHGQPETPISKLNEVLSKYKGTTWAGSLSGNGGRPVAIYVPEGFDPNKPAEVAYHFHGMHGQIMDIKRPPLEGTGEYYKKKKVGTISDAHNRIDQALGRFEKQGPTRNAILVYPLSAGQRDQNKNGIAWKQAYDSEWMKKGNDTGDDMEKLHQETIAQLGTLGININRPSVTLSGHSAGGIALRNIMTSNFHADKVKFLDASYGSWATDTYRAAMRNNPNTKFEVYVHSGSDTTDSAATKGLEKGKNVSYVRSPVAHEVFNQNFI